MTTTILQLGGNIDRTHKTVEVAKLHPSATIIVSTEGDPKRVLGIFAEAGIPSSRIYLDYRAWDTVTNFTLTRDLVEALGTTELIVVTDEPHMTRSMGIGLATYWPKLTLTPVPSPATWSEPSYLAWQDALRALVYRFTGWLWTWEDVKAARMPGIEAERAVAESVHNNPPIL